jgi:hypothetical protein
MVYLHEKKTAGSLYRERIIKLERMFVVIVFDGEEKDYNPNS